eukprot:m.487208 g.487208  ORF g.487208 m.487208 type:complete len:240 (+) comp24874_c0_seq1:32-751(+)
MKPCTAAPALLLLGEVTGVPDASYGLLESDPSKAQHLFEQCLEQVTWPAVNRGITRSAGAPKVRAFSSQRGPVVIRQLEQKLLDCRVVERAPSQISVNYYHTPSYEMVPHKDGYVGSAVIVSLGSHCCLRFWHQATTEEDRRAREGLRHVYSGTQVFEHAAERPCDAVVWLEPGSVLRTRGESLHEFCHGVLSSDADVFDSAQLANGSLVRTDIAPPATPVKRTPRISIVFWTDESEQG